MPPWNHLTRVRQVVVIIASTLAIVANAYAAELAMQLSG